MPYSTVVEVRTALAPGDWADDNAPDVNSSTNSAADLGNAQLVDAISEADSKIDSYIGGRYITPVVNGFDGLPYVSTPHPLDYWSRNIAAYLATLTFRKGQDLDDTDPVVRRYAATVVDLTAVRDGKATINIPDNEGNSGTAGAGDVFNRYTGGDMFQPRDFELGYGGSVRRYGPSPIAGSWN